MKIILLIDHLSGFGGAQRVIVNIANAMNKMGHQVSFLLTGNSRKCVYQLANNIDIYLFQDETCRASSKILKIRWLRKQIKELQPDVIISFLTMVNIMTILSAMTINIPVIISERNDPSRCTKLEKCLSKIFYRFADCIVVQTEDIKHKISLIYKKRIEVIENPLTDHNYEKIDYEQERQIIAVGRLNKQKNYNLLLSAFGIILDMFPGYKLDIYGAGDELEKLQQKCDFDGLSSAVSFKGNETNVIAKEPLYDFFVMSSDFEGMPNALAEALSVGLPCISTDCDGGGAAALISSSINGILVPKNDVDSLVEAMKFYITNPDFARRMGENAKEVKCALSNNNIMKKWSELIEAISKHSGGN